MSTATMTRPATVTVADQIEAAYTRDPDASFLVADLMDITGKSRTTVTDNLKKLAESGTVIRMDKDRVTTWSLTPTRKAAVKRAATKAAKSAAKTAAPKKAVASSKGTTTVTTETTTGENRTPTGRRIKGAIDAEITAYFQGNGNEPTGSYAVANAIGSSKGAAYVALKRMDREGTMVLVSTEPDRYALPA